MELISSLFATYSIEAVIIFVIMILLSVKFTWELVEWFRDKIKYGFTKQQETEEMTEDFKAEFKKLNDRLDTVEERFNKIDKSNENTNRRLSFIEERQQENTKSFLIDAHHKFCYQIKAIDDINLQSIERTYMYYKAAGGNSFIDQLMQEIRALPRTSIYTPIEITQL